MGATEKSSISGHRLPLAVDPWLLAARMEPNAIWPPLPGPRPEGVGRRGRVTALVAKAIGGGVSIAWMGGGPETTVTTVTTVTVVGFQQVRRDGTGGGRCHLGTGYRHAYAIHIVGR
jgi:hypothetical protein